jgi:hypothetical protein
MAYIGKQPSTKFSAAAKQDSFTGDGSTVAFDVANIIPAGGENGIQVYVDNVRQKPGSSNAYTIGNNASGDLKRITFTAAPDASAEIYVIIPYEATNIKNIGDGTVTTAKLDADAVTGAQIADDAVNSEHLTNGSVDNVHLAGSIADSKLSTITTAGKVNVSSLSAPGSANVFLTGAKTYAAVDTSGIDSNAFNISLLGFKMAVNEGLTIFNLVDGVVDEFNDESGTDEAEGSNDVYNAPGDYYHNVTASPVAVSAGFSLTAITEPDTSTAGTNPGNGVGTYGSYTVPAGLLSTSVFVWGAGGSAGYGSPGSPEGGGGGFSQGTLAVTGEQVLKISPGEGGRGDAMGGTNVGGFGGYGPTGPNNTGGGQGAHGRGGGLSGIFNNSVDFTSAVPTSCAANVYLVAGSGGAGGGHSPVGDGGAGGGPVGQDSSCGAAAEGGSQTAGGTKGGSTNGASGGFLYGGKGGDGNGGGAGWYGGGSGGGPNHSAGGGGSAYISHPQITSGSTEAGAAQEGGGDAVPTYSPLAPIGNTPTSVAMNIGGSHPGGTGGGFGGGDGYVLITATACTFANGASTTITSEAFAASSPVTTGRIVVFEENVDTPTLNTDIIASISRDGGTTFTAATLADSGYVTGASGQRILTGQATISGQPSGQSMRWKLALANNTVKIHGVSLQWS